MVRQPVRENRAAHPAVSRAGVDHEGVILSVDPGFYAGEARCLVDVDRNGEAGRGLAIGAFDGKQAGLVSSVRRWARNRLAQHGLDREVAKGLSKDGAPRPPSPSTTASEALKRQVANRSLSARRDRTPVLDTGFELSAAHH